MDSQGFTLSPAAIALPVLACITMIINIPPFIWHVKNRNLSATSLVFWIVLTLFFDFINALIWPKDNIANWFKGFILCDIEVKLMLGATVGIPGSLASIMRNLAAVLNTEKAVIMRTTSQRRKQFIIDFIFSFGFPIYMMAIHYVVQPSRYYIFTIAGCVVSFDDSWPTVVLMWIWPSVLSLVGVFYSGMCTPRTLRQSKLIVTSIGGHAHAQVSPGVFRYPRLDGFQTYQVSIQATILDVWDAHNNCSARPILYPFPKCILSLRAL
jgi:pheromone a factor receptor